MYYYNAGGVLGGAAVITMLQVGGDFISLCVLSFVFGVGAAQVFNLTPVLLADGVGPALLPSTLAITMVFMGLPNLYAPALGGEAR